MATSIPKLKKSEDLDRPFSLCGRRCYLIGFQNGLFPDYGWHADGEMGGVWVHPIKFADGFWISLEIGKGLYNDVYKPTKRVWLKDCNEFILGDGGAWVEHRYNLPKMQVSRREFIPYKEPAVGIDISVTSKNEDVKKAILNFLVRFDIQPVWFSGWPNPTTLEIEAKKGKVYTHSISNYALPSSYGLWTAALGSNPEPGSIITGNELWGPEKTSGNGSSVLLKYPLTLNPDAHIRLVLAGDCEGEAKALKTVDRVLRGFDRSLQRKIDHYSHVANELTTVKTPENLLNDAFLWSKLNLEWLTQTSPYVGTGVVAGHQDFAWYFGGDTELSIGGFLVAGLHEEAKQSLRLLANVGKKVRGRISHEILTNGSVFDWGRIGETTLFAQSVWDTYLWTGDETFLKEIYPVCKAGLLDYLLSQPSKDEILLLDTTDTPDGPRDKLCPSTIYLGFKALANMAERLGDNNTKKKASLESQKKKLQIEDLFWVDELGLYAGMLDENNKPVVSHNREFWGEMHTTFGGVAYTKVAEKSRVEKALSRFENPKYSTDWGLYLNYDRSFNMPITTGLAAVSEFNYGRVEQGLRFLRMIARTVGHIMPGAAPEYIHPSGDPEKYPPSSCYLQLWSAATYVQGLIWGLLHLEPDAARNRVVMQPQLPEDWSCTEFKNIIIGESKIDVRLERGKTVVNQISGPKLNIQINE